jgi:uncharacterized membrane protein
MYSNHLHYMPGQPLLYLLLGGLIVAMLVLLEIGLLNRAYLRLGLPPRVAMLVLLASLAGAYLNVPIARLPDAQVVQRAYVGVFGMPYWAPQVVDWPGTILAVNVGGAVIPVLLSLYLVVHNRLVFEAGAAIVIVAIVVHQLATPIAGVGISVPLLWPPILAAVVALILSRRNAAPLAYVGGSIGVLIGADLMNLDKLQSLGAPVASIGGAGTFDGVFLAGIAAVLLSGLGARREIGARRA